jgi:hypothetical protein
MKANSTPATMAACFMGCVVQAVANNFAPLLFVTFSSSYQLSLSRITLFITFNFLILLAFLPDLLDPFTGILVSVAFYAVGGGLLEVMVSPIMEACPSPSKKAAMVLLSDYSGLVRATIPERESC